MFVNDLLIIAKTARLQVHLFFGSVLLVFDKSNVGYHIPKEILKL